MAYTDAEWKEIMTLPTECCEQHGDECGYCFNCPVLPDTKGRSLAYLTVRLLGPCEEVAPAAARAGEEGA